MRSFYKSALVAIALLGASAGAAFASPITFTLTNASLVGTPASLTGSFTVSSLTSGSTLLSADITAAGGTTGSWTVPGFEYRFGLSSGNNSSISTFSLPTQYFDLSANNGNILRIAFSTGGLTMSGVSLSNSYETEGGVNRGVLSGASVFATAPAAVPEPSSIALLLTALAMLSGLGFMRARKRKASLAMAFR
jgi:hypothetical protein